MPNHPNTKSESVPLDAEDWEIAFEPFSEDSSAALMMGFNLMLLKSYLTVKPSRLQEAIESLDCTMEVVFQHTDFHDISYALFVRLAGGKLTLEEEEMLRSLGVKF
jgi:hypothetical protein